jgi:formylmethanofuran dehydrogenase subunit E
MSRPKSSPKRLDFKSFEEKVDKEGLVWEEKEEFEKAIIAYDKLLTEVESLSSSENLEKDAMLAYVLMRKAGVLLQMGKAVLGEQLMQESVVHAEKSRNSLIIARAKLGIGVFNGSSDRFEEAEKLMKAALASFGEGKSYDDIQGRGWTLLNLGGLYRKQGKLIQAEQNLLKAIEILKEIKNWVGVASAYEMKAKVQTAKGDRESAKKDLLASVLFYEKQGMTEKADSLKKGAERNSRLHQRLKEMKSGRTDTQVPEELVKGVVEFHGHLGLFLVLGLKAGLLANSLLGKDCFKTRTIVTINPSPPDSCFVDGIQFVTGCTMGKGNIELRKGKGVSVRFSKEGKTLTLKLRKETLDYVTSILSEEAAKEASLNLLSKSAYELFDMEK